MKAAAACPCNQLASVTAERRDSTPSQLFCCPCCQHVQGVSPKEVLTVSSQVAGLGKPRSTCA